MKSHRPTATGLLGSMWTLMEKSVEWQQVMLFKCSRVCLTEPKRFSVKELTEEIRIDHFCCCHEFIFTPFFVSFMWRQTDWIWEALPAVPAWADNSSLQQPLHVRLFSTFLLYTYSRSRLRLHSASLQCLYLPLYYTPTILSCKDVWHRETLWCVLVLQAFVLSCL